MSGPATSDDRNRRKQAEFYERHATRFDRSVTSLGCRDNRNHRAKVAAIAAAIGAGEGRRILEVGAGTGLHGRWMLEHTGVDYTGVDLSRPMLAVAADRLGRHEGRARLGVADACRLPFADGTFDAAYCSGTLHHLTEPGAGLRELARVTRPGGRVAALEPNWKFPSTLVIAATRPVEWNAFKLNESRMIEWARAAGLSDVRLERLLYTPPKPESWTRAFDRIDEAVAKVPGLRKLAIMLLVSGTKAT